MGEVTAISWCDHTFNPWIGCTKVSPACDGCYAEALMDKRYGRVEWGAPGKGNGTRVRTSAGNWRQPLRWNRKAETEGTRPFVFCSSLADVFDNQVPIEWRRDLFELIIKTPRLVWLLLTKRPQNIVKMFAEISHTPLEWPMNAAIGTTVEDQTRADTNVPHLLRAKAALRPAFAFLSCEPLLGAINLRKMTTHWGGGRGHDRYDALHALENRSRCFWVDGGALPAELPNVRVDWVITGGETDQGGHKARPSHPGWYLSLRDQCADAGIPFHHKQNGEWLHDPSAKGERVIIDQDGIHLDVSDLNRGIGRLTSEMVVKVGKRQSGRLLEGVEHNTRPQISGQ